MKEREIFESILTKFIINLPKEELEDVNRLSYHAEKAFYYYIDEIIREKDLKDW
jgi:predicted DNA-binding protein